MSETSGRQAGSARSLHAWVARHLEREVGGIVSVTDIVIARYGKQIAFTAVVTGSAAGHDARRVAVLDVTSGALWFASDDAETYGPSWSPDGARLAWVKADRSGAVAEISTAAAPVAAETVTQRGHVERVRWCPDGTRLLLVVADPGAELSDADGSGTLPDSAGPSAAPRVDRGSFAGGWRRAWVHALGSGQDTLVSPDELNVWQAAWAGADAIVCVTSRGPSESSWYTPSLVRIELTEDRGHGQLAADHCHALWATDAQLAQPAASADGGHVSVIAGAMSDRGLDNGELVVDGEPVDALGTDVTDHHWIGEDRIVFAGLRGLRTVIGDYSVSDQRAELIWDSEGTCGTHGPQVGVAEKRIVAWVHSYERSPALVEITRDGEAPLLDSVSDRSPVGHVEVVRWSGTDGAEIEGFLVSPDSPEPHPLIVHLHGGPVWAWRNEWSMHYPYTPLLVRRGYAVLHPNHRGSTGRGQRFIRDGLHDMGSADALDIELGVSALCASGRVDPRRVAVTGNSYGGFMSAWLAATSSLFAAAVARSPVTDWVSQHYTSNLPGFDRMCLKGDPLDVDSDYRRRSPLYLVDQIRIPMLFTAGAEDLATPAQQAEILHRALVERGRESTLVIYPEEGHGVRRHDALVDQCARMIEFFDRHLQR